MNSALVTGAGATAFTGPRRASVASAWRIAPTTSSRAIQLIHCAPLPMTPPMPSRNGVSILESAPPRSLSTTPSLRFTTRIPLAIAVAVAARRPTHERNHAVPAGLEGGDLRGADQAAGSGDGDVHAIAPPSTV